MQPSASPTMHNLHMAGPNIFLSISVFILATINCTGLCFEFNIDLCQTLTWTFTAVPTTTNVSYLCGFLIFQYSLSLTNNYTCQCKNLTWACMFCEIFQRPCGPLRVTNLPLFSKSRTFLSSFYVCMFKIWSEVERKK